MLAQVTVCLMPLVKQLPQQVAAILNYVIVENKSVPNFESIAHCDVMPLLCWRVVVTFPCVDRKKLSAYFKELYFIPDIAEFRSVQAVLQKHTTLPHK